MLAAENQPIEVSRCRLEQARHHQGCLNHSTSNPATDSCRFQMQPFTSYLALASPGNYPLELGTGFASSRVCQSSTREFSLVTSR